MDPLLLAAAVLGYLVAFFGDNVATWYWAHHKAPMKARELILGDPVFTETHDKLEGLEAELQRVRHDLEAHREAVRQEVAAGLKGFKVDVPTPQVHLPEWSPEMENRTIREIRNTLKRELSAAIEEYMEKQRPPAASPDADAQAAISRYEASLLAEELVEKGIPEPVVRYAFDKGPKVLRALALRYFPEYEEVIRHA